MYIFEVFNGNNHLPTLAYGIKLDSSFLKITINITLQEA